MAENENGLNTEDDNLRYEDTPLQPPTEQKAEDNKSTAEDQGADPSDPSVVRAEGPVGAPHWQALIDINRVLPCEVLPVNTTEWKTVVDAVRDDNSDQIVLVTDKGERLYAREIHDPVLVRTTADDANLLK